MLLLFKKNIFKNIGHKVKEFFKERQAHEEIWLFLSFSDKKIKFLKPRKRASRLSFRWFSDVENIVFPTALKTYNKKIFSLLFWLRKYHLFLYTEKIRIDDIFGRRKDGKYDFLYCGWVGDITLFPQISVKLCCSFVILFSVYRFFSAAMGLLYGS